MASCYSLGSNSESLLWREEDYGRELYATNSFLVSTNTEGDQIRPDIGSLSDEGYVTCWEGLSQSGSSTNIYYRRYDKDDLEVGNVTQVNEASIYDQSYCAVTGISGGGFAITWEDQIASGYRVMLQVYDIYSNKVDTQKVVGSSSQTFHRSEPKIALLEKEQFAVAFEYFYTAYFQRYFSNGTKSGSTTTFSVPYEYLASPTISRLNNGNIAMAARGLDIFNRVPKLYMRIYNMNGAPVTSYVSISCVEENYWPDITYLSNRTSLLLGWSTYSSGTGSFYSKFQIFNESNIATSATSCSQVSGPYYFGPHIRLSSLPDSFFVLIATGYSNSNYNSALQVYNPNGYDVGAQISFYSKYNLNLAPLNSDDFIVVFDNSADIYAKRYNLKKRKFLELPSANISSIWISSSGSMSSEIAILELNFQQNPIILYTDDNSYTDLTYVKLAFCHNYLCSSPTITDIDTTRFGRYISFKINSKGNPVMCYMGLYPSYDFKLLVCGNPTCTSNNITTVLESGNSLQETPVLKLDEKDNPVILYSTFEDSTVSLKLLVCGNPTCTSNNIRTNITSSFYRAGYVPFQWDHDGNPVILYRDNNPPKYDFKIIFCDDAFCNTYTNVTFSNIYCGQNVDLHLQINSKGHPVISCSNVLITCNDLLCSSNITTTYMEQVEPSSSFVLDGKDQPVIATDSFDELILIFCENPLCTLLTTKSLYYKDSGVSNPYIKMDMVGNPFVCFHNKYAVKLASIIMYPRNFSTMVPRTPNTSFEATISPVTSKTLSTTSFTEVTGDMDFNKSTTKDITDTGIRYENMINSVTLCIINSVVLALCANT